MKILVTGATGQLGYDVMKELNSRGIECCGPSRQEMDITDEAAVFGYIEACKPDGVIHCAAYTAVDRAEDEPEQCFKVNVAGTRNMARACKQVGAKMIFISSDYVFSGEGDRPYETDDATGPINVYGRSKAEGEQVVLNTLEKSFIVRTSWVFGSHGNNFVKTMLRLGKERDTVSVVADQIGSPTYTVDLAGLLVDMIATEKYGIYHATNEGFCSWAEFADIIFHLKNYKAKIDAIPTIKYPVKAHRPLNSKLSKTRLFQNGFDLLREWQNALQCAINDL